MGFIFENLIKIIFPSLNSGLLHGPWVPVYGFGICIIILIERFVFNRIKVNKFWKIVIMLLLIMIVVTGVEYLGGVFINAVFDKSLWDYSDLKFNIGKYIALEITAIWGVLSLIFVYVVKPWLEKIIEKIPKWASILVFCLMIIDFIVTLFEAL